MPPQYTPPDSKIQPNDIIRQLKKRKADSVSSTSAHYQRGRGDWYGYFIAYCRLCQPEAVLLSMDITKTTFSGSVGHFRAWMDEFLAPDGGIFAVKETGKKYEIGYISHASTTTRDVWNVYAKSDTIVNPLAPVEDGEERYGMILATESQVNVTTITIRDGACYERSRIAFRSDPSPPPLGPSHLVTIDPIGDDFVEITEWVLAALKERSASLEVAAPLHSTEAPAKLPAIINLQRKPAGRRIDPFNSTAYDILTDGNDNAELRAFEHWCKERHTPNPSKIDRDSFKKAMERVKKRRETK